MIGFINASPLIYLGKLGLLNHLPNIFSTVITSSLVKEEVLNKETSAEQPAIEAIFNLWLKINPVSENTPIYQWLIKIGIHPGEAQIITLAKTQENQTGNRVIVIFDDLEARQTASSLGLTVTGTIGIILALAKNKAISPDICRHKIDELIRNTTFRISPSVFAQLKMELDKLF